MPMYIEQLRYVTEFYVTTCHLSRHGIHTVSLLIEWAWASPT